MNLKYQKFALNHGFGNVFERTLDFARDGSASDELQEVREQGENHSWVRPQGQRRNRRG